MMQSFIHMSCNFILRTQNKAESNRTPFSFRFAFSRFGICSNAYSLNGEFCIIIAGFLWARRLGLRFRVPKRPGATY